MGYLGIMLIMRYHDDGGALVVQLGKQMHHLGTILGIEVTRRLIGKDELGTEDHGTGGWLLAAADHLKADEGSAWHDG